MSTHIHTHRERASSIFTFPKLFQAYLSCRERKRKTINAIKFELDLESNLLTLQKALIDRTYQPSCSICFVITYPKVREVFAADFCDRVVHHLLISQIEPYFERRFIYDSFACRKEKGCHTALYRLRKFLHQITKNETKNAFYTQVDIKSFFSTIDKKILLGILTKEIKKFSPSSQKDLLWLIRKIIFHDPTENYYLKGKKELFDQIPDHKTLFKAPKDKGLPIGNLTSQFFANLYLNELDQFVKRTLKVKYYLRYVDDLVLLSKDIGQLKEWREKVDHFLREKLKVELHPDKDKYGSVYQGINFVGYIIKPNYVLSRRRVVGNLKTKLHYFNQGLLLASSNQRQEAFPLSKPPSKEEIKQITSMINSYYGHFKHANSYNLRKNLYRKHFKNLKSHLRPKKGLRFFSQLRLSQTSPPEPTGQHSTDL